MLEPSDTEDLQSLGLHDSLEATVRIRLACLLALFPIALIGCSQAPVTSSPALAAVAITGTVVAESAGSP